MALPRSDSASVITLSWLLRLRWSAVGAQLGTVLVAAYGLGLPIPWTALISTIAITALSNLALWRILRRPVPPPPAVVAAVLVLDTLLLTVLLGLSGGPANPFAVLYLLHVTLAVVVLGTRWGWIMVALSAVSFAALFKWHVSLPGVDALNSREWRLHLTGAWIAVLVTASVIAYFVSRIAEELRAREVELRSIQAQVARDERLSSLTTLAAGAAHELGTPLATIAVVSKELERALAQRADAGPLAEDARLIREQVDRCRTILVQMSAKAGEHAGEALSSVPVDSLVAETLAALSPEQVARVRVERTDGARTLEIPRLACVQVLSSLLRNAFDASPEGAFVRLDVVTSAAEARIAVRDEGIGMPPEVAAKATDPFFTTKPPGRGMGLGLFLARTFAEKLGGRLELVSIPGSGTTVTITLPQAGRAKAA